ncbi:MAG: peptidoglycan-associated lipoprotein Pal [Desulfuromonadales bacterium]|nr:peptidoglycan-associated lipoprotein Pal [Chloroflexota bacterium]MCK4623328.1 peptidoglycan-associated lipoprotein Pal [Desulfuromonadales bacterium]
MPKLNLTRLVVMLFVLTLLAAGCAKKPLTEEPLVTEQPTQEQVLQQQPAVIEEQPVDEAAAEAARIAAAEAAANKAVSGLLRIYFDFDQYVLTDAARQQLARNASLLKAAPTINVQIEGHCDERGSDEYNLALGEKRAMATKSHLVSLGVSIGRVSIISYGEEIPLDPAKTEAAWAKNRRAEFNARR